MPSSKRLRAVAHSLAHQFASTLNYWDDDYAIHHLARAAERAGTMTVDIDVLGKTASPARIQEGVVAEIVAALRSSLDRILIKEGFSLDLLSSATLQYTFASDRKDPSLDLPCYNCISTLITTEGCKFEVHLTEKSN